MRYRKKPVEVEAVRVPTQADSEDDYMRGHGTILGWLAGHGFEQFEVVDNEGNGNGYVIHTREGDMRADPGDWIVREPFPTESRHFYPCKPDIFEATYEPVAP